MRFFYVMCLGLLAFSVHADPTPFPDYESAYPTLVALANTPLPARDRVDLARRFDGITTIAPPPDTPPDAVLGDQLPFHVINTTENTVDEVDATLRVISDHLLIWVESDALDMIPLETLTTLANAFDERVYPNVRALWGEEANPGVDGDPRVYALFARGVGSAAAYFSSENSYPPEVTNAGSGHEMFVFNLDMIAQGIDDVSIESIVAHEFQHMIRHNLLLNQEVWLNEGLSEITQLLLYNDPANAVFLFNTLPDTQVNTWSEDANYRGYHYGASLAFLTYLYDRYGMDALQLLSADSSSRGLDAFDNTLRALGEAGVNEFFADWTLANALMLPDSSIYGYSSFPDYMNTSAAFPVLSYPFAHAETVSQYAADVFALENLNGDPLTITLDAPRTVGLIADAGDGRFWYSNRGDMMDSTLTRAVDLTAVDSATLNYRLWFDTEDGWDYGYIAASADDGVTWTPLEGDYTTTPFDPNTIAFGASYNGESGGWVGETVSLDAYAGQNILLRFEMITDDGINRPGMAIDDVSIPEIDYTADFEVDDGGWEANGWLLTDNRLPQQAWVQVAQLDADNLLLGVERWLFAPPVDADETYSRTFTFTPHPNAARAVLILAPFAPVTTVGMGYQLGIQSR
jgi:hypothetical protein